MTVVVPVAANIGLMFAVWEPKGGVVYSTLFILTGYVFALSIDYDLFLFARMYERRMEGYDNDSALRLAMVETGALINTAGFLMCLALVPLLISNTLWSQQQGFFMIVGVAVDTLIVRTLLAPP